MEILHEFKHFEEFIKIGKKEYLKGHKALGSSLVQHLIRTSATASITYTLLVFN